MRIAVAVIMLLLAALACYLTVMLLSRLVAIGSCP